MTELPSDSEPTIQWGNVPLGQQRKDGPPEMVGTLRAILAELQAIRGILAAQAVQNTPDPEPRIE